MQSASRIDAKLDSAQLCGFSLRSHTTPIRVIEDSIVRAIYPAEKIGGRALILRCTRSSTKGPSARAIVGGIFLFAALFYLSTLLSKR